MATVYGKKNVGGKVEGGIRTKANGGYDIVRDDPKPLTVYKFMSQNVYAKRDFKTQTKMLLEDMRSLYLHIGNRSPDVLYNALIDTTYKSRVYCPKDTLALVKSSRLSSSDPVVSTNGVSREKASARISYGINEDPFYAITVHEVLFYRHKAPTRAKFLEQPVKEDQKLIEAKISSGFKTLFGQK
jgi:hypothetical protein